MQTARANTKGREPIKMALYTDNELCRMVAHDHPRAFEELYARYERRLARFAAWYIGDSDEVNDIVQETMIRVHRHAAKFDQKKKFSTWIHTITQRLCFNALRNKSRSVVTCFSDLTPAQARNLSRNRRNWEEDRLTLNFLDPKQDAEKQMEGRHFSERLATLIANLAEKNRKVFILREFRGKSYLEIASIMRTNVGTVKSRLFRAREALKDGLDPHQFH